MESLCLGLPIPDLSPPHCFFPHFPNFVAHSVVLGFQLLVVNGRSGLPIWNYELPCHMKKADALSVMTLDGKSVFLFWANEKQPFLKILVSESRSHVKRKICVVFNFSKAKDLWLEFALVPLHFSWKLSSFP